VAVLSNDDLILFVFFAVPYNLVTLPSQKP